MEFNYHQAISTVKEYFEKNHCYFNYWTSSDIGDDCTVFCAETIRDDRDRFMFEITATQANVQFRVYPGITIPDAYLPMGCVVVARVSHEYTDGVVKIDPQTGTVYAQINADCEGISVARLETMEDSVLAILEYRKSAFQRVAGGMPPRTWADSVYGIATDENIVTLRGYLDDIKDTIKNDAE